MTVELEDSSEPMEDALTLDQTAGGEFLSLDQLGRLLSQLASQGLIIIIRIFARPWEMLGIWVCRARISRPFG